MKIYLIELTDEDLENNSWDFYDSKIIVAHNPKNARFFS